MIAMSYGYVYVARIAMGYSDMQTLKAFLEADTYDGPSMLIAYSHCIAHGYDLVKGLEQQSLAVESGMWPLFRYNPTLAAEGKNPLQLDSKEPTIPVEQYAYNETRFRQLAQSDEPRAEALMKQAQQVAKSRWDLYRQMAAIQYGNENK
jgi:pyruvate-ferredoxin/flavodoxin oxidoreductase